MKIVKPENSVSNVATIQDLNVGDVFKFAAPWNEESEAQVYLVCDGPLGKCSVSLNRNEVVEWDNEGHETRLAILINAHVEIN